MERNFWYGMGPAFIWGASAAQTALVSQQPSKVHADEAIGFLAKISPGGTADSRAGVYRNPEPPFPPYDNHDTQPILNTHLSKRPQPQQPNIRDPH